MLFKIGDTLPNLPIDILSGSPAIARTQLDLALVVMGDGISVWIPCLLPRVTVLSILMGLTVIGHLILRLNLVDVFVHGFDPTIPRTTSQQFDTAKKRLWFLGVTDRDGVVEIGKAPTSLIGRENPIAWEVKTVPSFHSEQKHGIITILKMDVEGAEWWALTPVIEKGMISQGLILQLVMEIHFEPDTYDMITEPDGAVTIVRKMAPRGGRDEFAVLHALEAAGMKPWKWQWNVWSHCCIEVSYMYQP